jgi:hypothetical protein
MCGADTADTGTAGLFTTVEILKFQCPCTFVLYNHCKLTFQGGTYNGVQVNFLISTFELCSHYILTFRSFCAQTSMFSKPLLTSRLKKGMTGLLPMPRGTTRGTSCGPRLLREAQRRSHGATTRARSLRFPRALPTRCSVFWAQIFKSTLY